MPRGRKSEDLEKKELIKCAFCGVPFPEQKTPYKPIAKKDSKGRSLVFCCNGCAKAYEVTSKLEAKNFPPLHSPSKKTAPALQIDPSLEPYRFLAEKAVELGATRAIPLLAKDVLVDPRAKYKCFIPICRRLGTNLCCPPFSPSVDETLRLRDTYQHALLIQCEGKPEEFTYEATVRGAQLKYYLRLNNIVSTIESLAQKEGYYLAVGFGGGHCKICGHGIDPEIKCAGVVDGRPHWNRCRYPLRARPAVESVGIDIFRTARKAGIAASFHGITSQVEKVPTGSTFGIVFID